MTCIVGISGLAGSVWIAGDRAAVADGHYLTHTAHPKVFRRGPFLFGYTSSFRMGQLLQYRLQVGPLAAGVEADEYMATTFAEAVRQCMKDGGYAEISNSRERAGVFLVGFGGNLYTLDDDYNARRDICGYAACGSGLSVALGSLHATSHFDVHPSARLTMALEAASQFTTTVRGPFDVLSSDQSAYADG